MSKPIGRELNEKWGVGARHALYSETGTWYNLLERFPGALFDRGGYIKFDTKEQYERCSYLNIGQRLNVHAGIESIPGYIRKRISA
jgi:hypothetical protein